MNSLKKRVLLAGLLLAVCLSLAASIVFYIQVHEGMKPAPAVELSIPKGASLVRISELLAGHDIISSPRVFRLYARLRGLAGQLRSGYYRFEDRADMQQVLDRLVRGDVMPFQVTIPEGLRTDEVLLLLSEKTGLPLNVWQDSLHLLLPDDAEGRLLPETYQYTKPLDAKLLLGSMLAAQTALLNQLADTVDEQQKLRIMASIIEKETSLADERPIVAAVIRNRLQKHMPLQMDPTVIYGIWKTRQSFSGNIHKQDLKQDTPWNTYTRRGLPPTPIGNPGAAALRAAAHPADVDYLYFVANGRGGHVFASTLAEHQANVRAWVRIERQQNSH
ncbi:MAG TPA: endolytic transglycosylase MltG [Mariprofundaceae bacterium]|nr:endolytic transglycosylase MltG [Mariprofundaceae bacterium]